MAKSNAIQRTQVLRTLIILAFAVSFAAKIANAENIRIAVASNFSAPMKAITQEFERGSRHRVSISIGSSGKLYTQIVNGAPYDIFFSADQEKPIALQKTKLADANSRFTYAIGTLVLWSAESDNQSDVLTRLKTERFNKIAIANPRLAPYGIAAMQVLVSLGLDLKVRDKLVLGESVGQAWQYTVTGNSELGFISLSQLIQAKKDQDNNYWIVPLDYYSKIKQDAIVVSKAMGNNAVTDFLAYMRSNKVRELIKDYGYLLAEDKMD